MINSLYPFSIYSPLSDGVLYHSAALHACRAQKGGEDSDNETDDFCPSVLFHSDRGAHPSPSQREGALPLTWLLLPQQPFQILPSSMVYAESSMNW